MHRFAKEQLNSVQYICKSQLINNNSSLIMHWSTKILIVLSVLYQICQSDNTCNKVLKSGGPLAEKISQLQSGYVELYAQNPKSRYSYYNYIYKRKQTVFRKNIALTILYFNGYQNNKNVDYFINALNITNTGFVAILVVDEKTKWAFAHVHVFVTTRKQVFAGIFTIDQPYLYRPSGVNTTTDFNVIQSTFMPTTSRDVPHNTYIFISGLKSQETTFQISIRLLYYFFKERGIAFKITVRNSTKPIERLQVSYIGFTNSSGIEGKQYMGILFFDTIVQEQTVDQSSLSGMSKVSPYLLGFLDQGKRQNQRRLLSTLDDKKDLSEIYQTFSSDQMRRYKKAFEIFQLDIITTPMLKPVSDIKKDEVGCYTFDECTQKNGVLSITESGERICRICGTNSKYSDELKQCKCVQNTIQFGNICKLSEQYCGQDSIIVNNTCYYKDVNREHNKTDAENPQISQSENIANLVKQSQESQQKVQNSVELLKRLRLFTGSGAVIGYNLPNDATLPNKSVQTQSSIPVIKNSTRTSTNPVQNTTQPKLTKNQTQTKSNTSIPSNPLNLSVKNASQLISSNNDTLLLPNRIDQQKQQLQTNLVEIIFDRKTFQNKSVQNPSKNISNSNNFSLPTQNAVQQKALNLSTSPQNSNPKQISTKGIIILSKNTTEQISNQSKIEQSLLIVNEVQKNSNQSVVANRNIPEMPTKLNNQAQDISNKTISTSISDAVKEPPKTQIKAVKYVICSEFSSYNQKTLQCQCIKGYRKIRNKCDVQKCPDNEEWNDQLQKCVCNKGVMINQVCTRCSSSAFIDNTTQKCVCLPQYEGDGFSCRKILKKGVSFLREDKKI